MLTHTSAAVKRVGWVYALITVCSVAPLSNKGRREVWLAVFSSYHSTLLRVPEAVLCRKRVSAERFGSICQNRSTPRLLWRAQFYQLQLYLKAIILIVAEWRKYFPTDTETQADTQSDCNHPSVCTNLFTCLGLSNSLLAVGLTELTKSFRVMTNTLNFNCSAVAAGPQQQIALLMDKKRAKTTAEGFW